MIGDEPNITNASKSDYYKNWKEYDVYNFTPEGFWPEDATEIDDRQYHLWYRSTPWEPVGKDNEKNSALIDKYIEMFKEDHPEIEDPLKSDEFWLEISEPLICNSFIDRNYKMLEDYDHVRSSLQRDLCNFDVILPTSIVGKMLNPYIVYNIEKKTTYYATVKYDDYAHEQFKKYEDEWEAKKKEFDPTYETTYSILSNGAKVRDGKWFNGHDEYMRLWSTIGFPGEEKLQVDMVKQGHATFELKDARGCTEYRASIRWVSEDEKHNKTLHKNIW